MKHLGTKVIETERLVLRQFRMDDAEAMFHNWANDPEVTKYLTWPYHKNVEISRSVLSDWTSQYSKDDYYQWAIVLKDNGDEPIGSIAVVEKDDDLEIVQIGYCIGRKWWKQGVTSEALAALIKFFFEEVKVNRIEARHDSMNPNSGKVMMKCGMKYEGTKREADRNNQGRCDCVFYAILSKDYNVSESKDNCESDENIVEMRINMSEIERIDVNEEWAHTGIIRAGNLYFLNYCVGNVGQSVETQINGAIDQMEKRLNMVGLGLEDVVQMDCLFRDVWNIPIMEKVIKERFHGKYPVRKSIQTEFAHRGGEEGLLFQLDGIAYSTK